MICLQDPIKVLTQTVVKLRFVTLSKTAVENDGILDHYEAKSSGSDVNPDVPFERGRFGELWFDGFGNRCHFVFGNLQFFGRPSQ